MSTSITRVFVYEIQPDGTTGELLGRGSLVAPWIVALHPEASDTALARATQDFRLRCQIVPDAGPVQTFDGELVASEAPATGAAVSLDSNADAPVATVEWDDELDDQANADAFNRLLAELAASDPGTPPPPPERADAGPTPGPVAAMTTDVTAPMGAAGSADAGTTGAVAAGFAAMAAGRKPWWCRLWPNALGCGG